VILVDNASTDGTATRIAREYPEVRLERSKKNLGFAGGMNVGIRLAIERECQYILVLNNDTLLDPDLIRVLIHAGERLPRAGAISPLITFADAPHPIWFAGAHFSPKWGMPGRMSGYREPAAQAGSERQIERFTGAAALLRARALAKVGMFDESLFFLYEDVELSLRLRRAGWEVWLTPDTAVRHRVAMSQGGEHSSSSYYYGTRNLVTVGRRYSPAGPLRENLRQAVAVGAHLARARRAPRGARRQAVFATHRGWRDARAGRAGAWE
jgi:hypothetical protein